MPRNQIPPTGEFSVTTQSVRSTNTHSCQRVPRASVVCDTPRWHSKCFANRDLSLTEHQSISITHSKNPINATEVVPNVR